MSAAPVLTQLKKITLQVVSGPAKGEVFHLAKPVVKIGRGPENDVILDRDSKISRFHIEVQQVHGLVQIHNVTDKNSMLVNGKLVKSALLDGNTSVVIGETQLNFLFESNRSTSKNLVVAAGLSAQSVAGVPGQMQPYQGRQQPAMPTQWSQQRPQQQQSYQQFQAPNYGAMTAGKKSPKILIYGVVAALLIAGAFVFSGPKKNPKKPVGLKTTEEYQGEVETSSKATEQRNKELEKIGEHTVQYDMAQQQYVKGFRDFHHQQYGRAIISLRTALSYYPQHELARRYLSLAQKKQDEIVQSHMDAGARYKGEGNYRMCTASYSKVLRTLEDQTDKNYKAAEQYMKECEAEKKERY